MVRVDLEELIAAVLSERRAEISAVRREMQSISGEERERRGRAILGLRGKVVGEILGQKIVRFSRAREIRTNIRPGDVVLISRGNPLRGGTTGTVVRVAKHFIEVALDEFSPWMRRNVRVDFYVDDTTFRRWLDVLRRPNDRIKRFLSILWGETTPKIPKPQKFTPLNARLDETKRRAVALALGVEDVFLIHGPFGTGKTTALAELILQFVRRGKRVLATAETNVAVDNLVEKLWGKARIVRVGNPARVTPALVKTTLQAKMVDDPRYAAVASMKEDLQKLMEERDRYVKPVPKFRRGLSDEQILELAEKGRGIRGVNKETVWGMAEWIKRQEQISEMVNEIRRREEQIAKSIVREADVVLTTNSSAALDIVGDRYNVAVIDEAAQATIPSVLIPISRADRVVMAGDHKQLPPTILSQQAKILERTAFEIIAEQYSEVVSMLEIQYRMNEVLANFPSREFYDGKVKTAEVVKRIGPKDLGINEPEITLIDTRQHPLREERRRAWDHSIKNILEARIAKEWVENYLNRGVDPKRMGVITAYDAQRDVLATIMPDGIEVNTVDGYQGREKDIILISFARSNEQGSIGFLSDMRRLNVALTRARRKLVLIGDFSTLESHPTYARLLKYVKEHGEYVLLHPKGEE
ncbi:MAG: IGHMBP2 family helicase [Candidatus Diapherotrites archaeon]|nr:IGHMBP2 family helicase [Candidatus Diapherotrites archaeon]